MNISIKLVRKSVPQTINPYFTGGLSPLASDSTPAGDHGNAITTPTADPSPAAPAPQPMPLIAAETMARTRTTKEEITGALELPPNANAAEIYAALANAPRGSSAEFLLRALDGECGSGEQRTVTAPFADLTDVWDLEDALDEGLAEGSLLIDWAFCHALDNDAVERALVDEEGCPAKRWDIEHFGEPFDLAWLMQDKPFEPPFAGELVQFINDLWLREPRRKRSKSRQKATKC